MFIGPFDKDLTYIKERSKTLRRLTENHHCRIDTGSHLMKIIAN